MNKFFKICSLCFFLIGMSSEAFCATFKLTVANGVNIIHTQSDGTVSAELQYLGACAGTYFVPKNSPTTLTLQFEGQNGEEGGGCANGNMSITQFAVNPLKMEVGESLNVRVVSVMYYNQLKIGRITRIK